MTGIGSQWDCLVLSSSLVPLEVPIVASVRDCDMWTRVRLHRSIPMIPRRSEFSTTTSWSQHTMLLLPTGQHAHLVGSIPEIEEFRSPHAPSGRWPHQLDFLQARRVHEELHFNTRALQHISQSERCSLPSSSHCNKNTRKLCWCLVLEYSHD